MLSVKDEDIVLASDVTGFGDVINMFNEKHQQCLGCNVSQFKMTLFEEGIQTENVDKHCCGCYGLTDVNVVPRHKSALRSLPKTSRREIDRPLAGSCRRLDRREDLLLLLRPHDRDVRTLPPSLPASPLSPSLPCASSHASVASSLP